MAPRLARLVCTAAVVSALTGCAARRMPLEYQLTGPLLVPPVAAAGNGDYVVRIPTGKRPGAACGIDTEGIRLTWRGSTAEVRTRAAIFDPAPNRIDGPPESARQFRRELVALVERNCLDSGDAVRILDGLVRAVPMPPASAYAWRYGSPREDGYVDLASPMRLHVTAPLLRDPNLPAIEATETSGLTVTLRTSGNLIGFETIDYALRDSATHSGVLVERIGGERRLAGDAKEDEATSRDYFQFPREPRFYRQFFLTRSSSLDNDIAILGGKDLAELERYTETFRRDPAHSCPSIVAAGGYCVLLPTQMALNVQVEVMMNGSPLAVSQGGTVGEALRVAGAADLPEIVGRLHVWRPFEGTAIPVTFDRGKTAITQMTLLGGERIEW